MERRLTEEQITKNIIVWLQTHGWKIVCYDFPQSGTGISLHLNKAIRTTKNKGSWIPDIVAVKNNVALFFENKNRFTIQDFIKIQNLKTKDFYFEAISRLLSQYNISQIYYGVGLPDMQIVRKMVDKNKEMIDFAILSTNTDIKIFLPSHSSIEF